MLLNTNACNVNTGKGGDRTQNNIAKNDVLEDSFLLPNKRGLEIANLNIISLPKHIDELRILLSDRCLDVLTINETRLDDTISDEDRRDRSVNGRNGGRVCSFVVQTDLKFEKLENLSIEIRKPRSKPFLITTWYRPPSSPVVLFTHFEALVGQIDSENIEHIILEDFNCDFLSASNSNNDTLQIIAVPIHTT